MQRVQAREQLHLTLTLNPGRNYICIRPALALFEEDQNKKLFTLNAFIQTLCVTTRHATCHLHSIIVTADLMNKALPSHNKAFKILKVDVLLYECYYEYDYSHASEYSFLHVVNPRYTRTDLASASAWSLYCADVIK